VDAAFSSSQVRVPANGQVSCFGFPPGTFIPGTDVQRPNWDGVGGFDECYGIAPGRTIWHAWPGHDWVQMPHHNQGRADNTLHPQLAGGNHRIVVYVAGPPASHWYSDLHGSAWTDFSRCASGQC
jgi:hypothetical protein